MSIADGIRSMPARDYDDAFARFRALRALDGRTIIAQAYSRLWSQLERRPLCVVLFHGLTNCPEQWSAFASQLHARGHNVVVPRFPGHGEVNRRGLGLAKVRSNDSLATATEAVDIACGLGERIVVAGLSSGGALAAWIGAHRADVELAIPISPLVGLVRVNAEQNALLCSILQALPNVFLPWDPVGDGSQIPAHGYPDFPTHGLAAAMRIGLDAVWSSRRGAPAAQRVQFVTNRREPVLNNQIARAMATAWNVHRRGSSGDFEFDRLPFNHDIIDPTNPLERTAIVYPKLREIVESALEPVATASV